MVPGPSSLLPRGTWSRRAVAFCPELTAPLLSLQLPLSLNAPADQDVTVTISPGDAQRLKLSTNTITFAAGETGPKARGHGNGEGHGVIASPRSDGRLGSQEVELMALADGRTSGDRLSGLTLTTTSIGPGYNGLTRQVDLTVEEDRRPGLSAVPSLVSLAGTGTTGTLTVQLAEEPFAPITILLQVTTPVAGFSSPLSHGQVTAS